MSTGSSGSTEYFIRIRGKIHGPFDVERLKKLQARGQFSRANEISVDRRSWQPATTLVELFEPAVETLEEADDHTFFSPDTADKTGSTKSQDDDEWHYRVGDSQRGPVSLEELKRLVSDGVLKRHDQVWRARMPEWRDAADCPQLFSDGEGSTWFSRWWLKGVLAACCVLLLTGACALGWWTFSHFGQGHGTLVKFNNGELYYTVPFSDEDARRLGNYLVQQRVFDGEQKIIQLTRNEKSYAVRIGVKKGTEMDQEYVHFLRELGTRISHDVFADAPLEIQMCDDHLITLRVIPMAPLSSSR